jgi:hypothetical protein
LLQSFRPIDETSEVPGIDRKKHFIVGNIASPFWGLLYFSKGKSILWFSTISYKKLNLKNTATNNLLPSSDPVVANAATVVIFALFQAEPNEQQHFRSTPPVQSRRFAMKGSNNQFQNRVGQDPPYLYLCPPLLVF